VAVCFAVLETGLRLGGYGYETSFFKKTAIDGRPCYIENPTFGYRFFPPEIARVPSPAVFPVEKGSNTYRIFILGESAALGDPEPAFGVGRFLQALLEQRYPGTKFEVIPAAMTAINSHALLPIAKECAGLKGDLWIVYMGNNEFVGPFGASTVFGSQAPPRALVRAGVLLKATRTGQWIEALRRKMTSAPAAKEWGSLKMFAQNQVGPDDPRRKRIYGTFEKNLDAILEIGKGAGVKVIASSVVSNLKDCAPFASMGPDAQNAEVLFQRGRNQLAANNVVEALKSFELARDDDALPFRADSIINGSIRRTAEARGVEFVDAVAALPTKIPGEELIYEHVHLNFEGNYWLAKTFCEPVARALPEGMKKNAAAGWATFDEAKRRLALTEWDQRRVYEEVGRRIAQAPFINQSNHTNQVEFIRQRLAELRAQLTPARFAEVKIWYEEALKRDGSDFYLRGNYAKLLEDNNDARGAIAQWDEVRKLLPHQPVAYFNRGKLLAQVGDNGAALDSLQSALAIRPDLVEALDEEGKIYLRSSKPGEALKAFEQVAQLRPNNSRVCVEMADALARLNRRPEAVKQLERAIELQTNNWEARYLLGVEYAAQNRIKEAQEQFQEVVKLKPDYSLAHLNLGVALAKEQKLREAVGEFQQTLLLDPNNARAKDFLRQLGITNSPAR